MKPPKGMKVVHTVLEPDKGLNIGAAMQAAVYFCAWSLHDVRFEFNGKMFSVSYDDLIGTIKTRTKENPQ